MTQNTYYCKEMYPSFRLETNSINKSKIVTLLRFNTY